MTDKVNSFRNAEAAMQRAAGYKRGMANLQVVNFVEKFRARGVDLGALDGQLEM